MVDGGSNSSYQRCNGVDGGWRDEGVEKEGGGGARGESDTTKPN